MAHNTVFLLNKWNKVVVQYQKRHCVVPTINLKNACKEKHDVSVMVAVLMVQLPDFPIRSWKRRSVFYKSSVLITCKCCKCCVMVGLIFVD